MAKTKRKAKSKEEEKLYLTTVHDTNTGKLLELQAYTNKGTGRRYELKETNKSVVGLLHLITYEVKEITN